MVIKIKKPVTKEKIKKAFSHLSEGKKKKSLHKHFGKLKRGLDGLAYQKMVRNEWN
jgi:hypothetical protein